MRNQRREERYPIVGQARLVADGMAVHGELSDISLHGLAVRLHGRSARYLDGQPHWRCHLQSPDLPSALDFGIRVIHQRSDSGELGLGCEITDIDERPLVLLKAYRILAQARQRHCNA